MDKKRKHFFLSTLTNNTNQNYHSGSVGSVGSDDSHRLRRRNNNTSSQKSLLVFCLLLLLSLFTSTCHAFYLPGTTPESYRQGSKIDLKVVKLTSVHTHLPYEFYSLPFCAPERARRTVENLGEILGGDRIMESLYDIRMLQPVEFKLLDCPEKPMKYTSEDIEKFRSRIEDEYRIHWLLDNLPSAVVISAPGEKVKYALGFPIGHHDKATGAYVLYNHVSITINYSEKDPSEDEPVVPQVEVPAAAYGILESLKNSTSSLTNVITDPSSSSSSSPTTGPLYHVVGFEIVPMTIAASSISVDAQGVATKTGNDKLYLRLPPNSSTLPVYWTYSVNFKNVNMKWYMRWETYLQTSDYQIHWYSIANSIFIVIFLAGIVTVIMIRTLNRDIARYNDEEYQDAVEETGWKLVHGDVFRPPRRASLLTAVIGGGIQILETLATVITCAMLGFLSPASRGSMISTGLALFVLLGLPTGYYSARIYRTIRGQNWKSAALLTALLYPGIVFSTYFFLNFFVWGKHSSGAIPFGTLVVLLLMWFGISTPFVFVGAYFGYRKAPYEHPVRTNQIPRQIPPSPWYMSWPVSVLLTGILPFGAVFIELFFVFSAIWENKQYYLYGILFLVFLILVVTSGLITIVMIYFFLCNEDYHWWWRSYILSAGMSFYVLLYAIYFYITQLDITDTVSVMLFIGYTFIIVVTFFFLCGTVGFYSAYWFVCRIYGQVKTD